MTVQQRVLYVRRGSVVKGPIPTLQVSALVKAGKIMPTDYVAESSSGPWTQVGALSTPPDTLPVVEKFRIRRAFFRDEYTVAFHCPKCAEGLVSTEQELSRPDTCPKCRCRYRISPHAAEQLIQLKTAREKRREAAGSKQQRQKASNSHDATALPASRHTGRLAQRVWAAMSRSWREDPEQVKQTRQLVLGALVLCGVIAAMSGVGKVLEWRRRNTPVALFERFAQSRLRNIAVTHPLLPLRDKDIDLRKTDSLTAPYVGSLSFTTVQRIKQNPWGKGYVIEGDLECEATFEKREDYWDLKKAVLRASNWRLSETDEEGVGKKVVEGMNREGVPAEELRDWSGFMQRMGELAYKGFSLRELASLNESTAYALGNSNESLEFGSLAVIEPEALATLIEARKRFVEAGRADDKYDHDNSWPYRPEVGYGWLALDNLEQLSDRVAELIAGFHGSVSLDHVKSLSDEAAAKLGLHRGPLSLKSLEQVSSNALVALAKHTDDVALGVKELPHEALVLLAQDTDPKQRFWPEKRKHIQLNGLEEVPESYVAVITNSPCRFSLGGLQTLDSTPLAKRLISDTDEEDVSGEWFEMSHLKQMSDEVADLVAQFPGDVRLYELRSLTSVRLAKKFVLDAGQSKELGLSNIEHLTPAAAKVLAEFPGELEVGSIMTGIDELSPELAAALAIHAGELTVRARSLQRGAAEALAKHEGNLRIESEEEVLVEVLDPLAEHKGEVVVAQDEPEIVFYKGGYGRPLKAE